MSKLDHIAARVANGWKYGDDPDLDWLVARVRQLETALSSAAQVLRHVFDADCSTGKTVYDAQKIMREALKES